MKLSYRHVTILVAAIALAVGCDEQTESHQPPTEKTTQPVVSEQPPPPIAPVRKPRARWSHNGKDRGFGMLTRAALNESTITDEQRTKIEALRGPKDEPGTRPAPPAAMMEFHKAIADAVKAGKIDEKALASNLAAMNKFGDEVREKNAKRLNDLHEILTLEQRKSVVDSVRKGIEQQAEKMKSMMEEGKTGDKPADKAGDKPAPGEHARADGKRPGMAGDKGHKLPPLDKLRMMRGLRRPGGSGDMPGGRLGHMGPGHRDLIQMVQGLDLTEEQQKKLDAITKKGKDDTKEQMIKKHEEAKKNLLALLDAFEKDTFDATKLEMFKAKKDAGDWMKKHLQRLSQIVTMLTEDQRAKLATMLSTPGAFENADCKAYEDVTTDDAKEAQEK